VYIINQKDLLVKQFAATSREKWAVEKREGLRHRVEGTNNIQKNLKNIHICLLKEGVAL
jgi:hypothetical protein